MKIDLKMVGAVAALLALIAFLVYGGDSLGLETDVETDLIALLPGIGIFVVGMFLVPQGGLFALPGLGAMGVGLAFLLEEMYNLELISTEMLQGLTIGEVQLWCIVLSLLIGAVVSGVTKK